MMQAGLALWLACTLALAPQPLLAHCPACALRSDIRHFSLEAIKRDILSKLSMETAPNMTGRQMPNIPPLSKLFEGQMDRFRQPAHDEADDSATTQRVIAFAQPHPRKRHWRKSDDALYFKFSEKVQDNRVLKAKLWLWLKDSRPMQVGPEEPIRITVFLVGKPNDFEPLKNVSNITESVGKGDRWISLDIREVVRYWFRSPQDNFGIVAKTSGPGANKVHLVTSLDDPSLVPFVELNTTEAGKKSRSKRTALSMECTENSTETKCCRYPLRVDFEEFGWDWIIAPKKYDAHYCSGECPFVFLQEYTHTHLAQMSNKSTTCCAPRKMSSISMLYFDKEFSIIYSILPGMVVDRCGCV